MRGLDVLGLAANGLDQLGRFTGRAMARGGTADYDVQWRRDAAGLWASVDVVGGIRFGVLMVPA